MPVAENNGTVQVALDHPLDPVRADEIHFAIKREVQVVVADPAEIEKIINQYYGQEEENEDFSRFFRNSAPIRILRAE